MYPGLQDKILKKIKERTLINYLNSKKKLCIWFKVQIFYKIFIILNYAHKCVWGCVHEHVCVCTWLLMSTEARGIGSHWSWNYRWLWITPNGGWELEKKKVWKVSVCSFITTLPHFSQNPFIPCCSARMPLPSACHHAETKGLGKAQGEISQGSGSAMAGSHDGPWPFLFSL